APPVSVKVTGDVAVTGNVTLPATNLDLAAATLTTAAGAAASTVNLQTSTTVNGIDAKGSLTLAGNTVTVTGTAAVAKDATLAIGSTAGLTLNGEVTVATGAAIEVSGTYTLDADASGTNNGTVTVNNGGEIKSYAHIDGDGENIVKEGGKVGFDSVNTTTYIAGPGGLFVPSGDGTFTYGNGFYTINGPVSVNGTWNTGLIGLHDIKLHVASGTLTIPTDKWLRLTNADADDVADTAHPRSLTGAEDAKIEVVGKLYLEKASVTVNFYTSTGTVVSYTEDGAFYVVPAGTYNWTPASNRWVATAP
ncbi:MAG: hypothetical protein LBU28_09745, partial [Spirochaetaceae bacterium]|nr:hypothetical protein [Spirochaetaceae bacterium]